MQYNNYDSQAIIFYLIRKETKNNKFLFVQFFIMSYSFN